MKNFEIVQTISVILTGIALVWTLLLQNQTLQTQQRQVNEQSFFVLLNNFRENAKQVLYGTDTIYRGYEAFTQMTLGVDAALAQSLIDASHTPMLSLPRGQSSTVMYQMMHVSNNTYRPYLLSLDILGQFLTEHNFSEIDKQFYYKTIYSNMSQDERKCLGQFVSHIYIQHLQDDHFWKNVCLRIAAIDKELSKMEAPELGPT